MNNFSRRHLFAMLAGAPLAAKALPADEFEADIRREVFMLLKANPRLSIDDLIRAQDNWSLPPLDSHFEMEWDGKTLFSGRFGDLDAPRRKQAEISFQAHASRLQAIMRQMKTERAV